MSEKTKQKVADIFNELADAIESGQFGEKKKIGLTLLGNEHGKEELKKAAEIAGKNNSDIKVETIGCNANNCLCLADEHKVMIKS
jgi:glycine/sarcosine/betaine reductase complex component C subunit alpha